MNYQSPYYFSLLLLGGILLTGCEKEVPTLHYESFNPPTDVPLHAVQVISNDTGYFVGGGRYEKGVFLKTYDGGTSWQSDSIVSFGIYDLQFFNSQKGRAVAHSGKILFTSDRGDSWNLLQAPHWKGFLSLYYLNQEIGFAAGGSGYGFGVFSKTTDGGQIWKKQNLDRSLRDIYFINKKIGLACGYGIILRTTDGGDHWDATNARDDNFFDMSFPSDQVGYAIGYNGVILKTTDQGQHWKKIKKGNSILPERKHYYAIQFWNTQKGYAVGDNGTILYTRNGGEDWRHMESFTDKNLRCIWLTQANSGWIGGESGGVYQFKRGKP